MSDDSIKQLFEDDSLAAAEAVTAGNTVGDGTVAPGFRYAQGRELGYYPPAVDGFLSAARESFESGSKVLAAREIRLTSFPLRKHGYRIQDVDQALARVEEAFAERQRRSAITQDGAQAWVAAARVQAQEVLDHLSRPDRKKFSRGSWLAFGYRVDEVDQVMRRIVGFLRDGTPLSAEQVRSVAFRMQRGGYREDQVDALLDATLDVILAVR